MKRTVKPEAQPKPPLRVILDLSEGEAGLLRAILGSVTGKTVLTVEAKEASNRLHEALGDHAGRHRLPYNNYFEEE